MNRKQVESRGKEEAREWNVERTRVKRYHDIQNSKTDVLPSIHGIKLSKHE